MKNRKRTAWITAPLLLVGLTAGGAAWGQQGEGRRGEGSRIARAEHGEERGGRHMRGHRGRRGDHEGRGGHERRGRGHERTVERLTKKLELTDEQVKSIKGVLTDARKKRIGLRADFRVARIELREMVSQESVDKAGVNAKVDAIAKIRGDMLRARTDAALAVREVLTPEQLAKADNLLKRMLKGGKGRGGRRGRGHR